MTGNFYDSLNLASKLTLKRILNGFRIYVSYYLSRILKKPYLSGLPVSLSFEPTTSCNLRCPECPSGLRSFTRPTGMLQEDLFRKVIDEISDKLIYLTFYFQGEPYLNPSFLDMVSHASSRKVYTSTSTNAHYLTEENIEKTLDSGLDRLIISIDGTTQATYESYRKGGNLQKVLEGTERLIKRRCERKLKKPFILFQYLVVKPNEHQIDDVQKLAKEIGVDKVAFKTAQIYDYENGSALIPTNDKFSRYKKASDGKYTIKNELLNQCWKMWHSSVITWDGRVVPCCFDKDATHQMGNVESTTFEDIWSGDSYNNFRSALLRSRKEIDICKNCSEGTKVWA